MTIQHTTIYCCRLEHQIMFVFIVYLVAKKLVKLMFVVDFITFSIGIEAKAVDT